MRDYYPCIKSELKKFILENDKNEDLIINYLIHNGFCTHINKRGKYINEFCLCISKNKNKLCKRHDIKNIKKCSGVNNRNKPCNRNVKKDAIYCNYCIKKKSSFYNVKRNIYNINIIDSIKSNKNKCLVKYFDIKNYIINRYYLLLEEIKNILLKYKISINFFINFLKILVLSKNDKNFQIHSTYDVSIHELNSINCIMLMQYMGYNYEKDGKRFRFKTENFNIVITDEIMFFDNNSSYGHIGAINLYKYITKKNIKDVLKNLRKIWFDMKYNKIDNFAKNKINKKDKKINSKNNTLPEEFIGNINIVKNYLIDYRKLDKYIIEDMIKNNLISSDKYKNCIFFNKNKTTAYLRGTNPKLRFFKASGEIDFIVYNFGNGPVYLFESPIDCISYYQLYNKKGIYISTNGSTLININRIKKIIEKYNKYNITYLCFDNDKAGNNFADKIKNNINKKFCRYTPNKKDWNDDLLSSKI